MAEPSFSVGIEEEYLLVDPATRDLVGDPPAAVLEECQRRHPERFSPEFLRSQIEVGTSKRDTVAEAAAELAGLRRCVIEVAEAEGLAVIAASTHPFAAWDQQRHTPKERYDALAKDLQAVARRLLICGMHVHVGLDDDELRIDLMSQVSYFLPHLLALTTSSPFWKGQPTGLKSYRLSVFDELPRTGLPEAFETWSEYSRHVQVLVDAGLIEDASKIWWDVRPSARFPTLEMRVMDVCTRLDDGVAVAALYVGLLAMLHRLKRDNKRWRRYSRMLIMENRWRAQRYGIDEGLVDFGKGEVIAYPVLLGEILDLIEPAARDLGCWDAALKARDILERGTSAHRQIAAYEAARAAGQDEREATRAVVDLLIEETKTCL